jgi:hypothetical protein
VTKRGDESITDLQLMAFGSVLGRITCHFFVERLDKKERKKSKCKQTTKGEKEKR